MDWYTLLMIAALALLTIAPWAPPRLGGILTVLGETLREVARLTQ